MTGPARGQFLDQVLAIVGPSGLLTGPAEIAPFVTDWRGIKKGTAWAVVRPASTEAVSQVIRVCAEQGVAVLPQGGNTGLTYATVDPSQTPKIILSLARMNTIRHVDPMGMTIVAEAGCILQAVKSAAETAGRSLPISLAAEGSAMIGGVIATNAGGTNVLRHGMTRQFVLGLEAVLADGSVVSSLRALRKDNAGYDWKQLFIGSEGTLGVVTAATLRMLPAPRFTEVALIAVQSPAAALQLLNLMQDELGDTLSAFELIPDAGMQLVERHFGLRRLIGASPWLVLVEVQSSLMGLREGFENAMAAAFETGIAEDGVIAESKAQAAQIWALREHLTEAEQREGASIKHDVSVPIPSIAEFLEKAAQAVLAIAPDARFNLFGHLGDGNIHFNVLADPALSDQVNEAVHNLVIALHGSISAEHGIGRYRIEALRQMRSEKEMVLMKLIKHALDPSDRFSPDVMLDRD